MAKVKVSEAIASMMWTACLSGEPIEVTLFRDWLEAYHIARLQELRDELETALAVPHSAADALMEARDAAGDGRAVEDAGPYEGDPGSGDKPAEEETPLDGFVPVEPKKPGPWARKKQRIMERLDAARARGVSRGEIAEASDGKLELQDVMDFIERKQKPVDLWDALAAALKKLEEGAADEKK